VPSLTCPFKSLPVSSAHKRTHYNTRGPPTKMLTQDLRCAQLDLPVQVPACLVSTQAHPLQY
jgi:hypothetical protein